MDVIDVFGPLPAIRGNDLTERRWRPSFSYAEERERERATEDRERGVGSRTILESQPWLGQHGKARFFLPEVARTGRWGRERERA